MVGKNDDRESIVTDKSISKSRGVRIIRSFYIITIAGKLFAIIHSFCFLGTVLSRRINQKWSVLRMKL